MSARAFAETPPYRVSGILDINGSHPLAVIELAPGRQGVYRPGDRIGDGRVTAISAQGVEIVVNGEPHVLALRRDLNSTSAVRRREGEMVTTTAAIDFTEAAARMAALKPGNEAREQLNRILSLPSEARITAVGRTPVANELEAAALLREAMRRGEVPRVVLSGIESLDEVYLTPEEGAQAAAK